MSVQTHPVVQGPACSDPQHGSSIRCHAPYAGATGSLLPLSNEPSPFYHHGFAQGIPSVWNPLLDPYFSVHSLNKYLLSTYHAGHSDCEGHSSK